MGILSGALRLRRYQVVGEVPAGFRDPFEEAIRRHGFREFEPDDPREQALGWVGVDDWFDLDLHLDRWLVGNLVVLTLRVDTKRIPARFLRQECRKAEAEWKLKMGREALARAERDEVRAAVRTRLLERVIPACQGVDMAWDLDRGEVLFGSTGDTVNELFRSLFQKTFGVSLRPAFPFLLALHGVGEAGTDLLERAVPCSFGGAGGA